MKKLVKKVVTFDKDSTIQKKTVYTDNSFTTEERDGTIKCYNIKSNLDGQPAITWTDGRFETELFFTDGVLDNEKGPAIYQTSYHPVGYRINSRYFLNGQEISFDDHRRFRESGLSKKDFLNQITGGARSKNKENKIGFLEKIKNLVTT
jgi:hypothetical protein